MVNKAYCELVSRSGAARPHAQGADRQAELLPTTPIIKNFGDAAAVRNYRDLRLFDFRTRLCNRDRAALTASACDWSSECVRMASASTCCRSPDLSSMARTSSCSRGQSAVARCSQRFDCRIRPCSASRKSSDFRPRLPPAFYRRCFCCSSCVRRADDHLPLIAARCIRCRSAAGSRNRIRRWFQVSGCDPAGGDSSARTSAVGFSKEHDQSADERGNERYSDGHEIARAICGVVHGYLPCCPVN